MNAIRSFSHGIYHAMGEIEDNPERFGITDLMKAASRVFNDDWGSSITDVVRQNMDKVQLLLSEGADIGQTDTFGRNAYFYIAQGATAQRAFPGRARMLDTLMNSDPHFERNILARDHMGKTALDSLMEGHQDNEFLSPHQLATLNSLQSLARAGSSS